MSDVKFNFFHSIRNRILLVFSNRKNLFDVAFLIFASSIVLFGRWTSIKYPIPLNADEVQAAANTLRIAANGLNWNSLDGTTVGPLNSLILMWPKILGLDVTIASVRLTSALILICICLIIYWIGRIFVGRWWGALCVFPLILFYAFAENPDFLHYSSELLPLLLLILATYFVSLISTHQGRSSIWFFMLIGLCVGAVPFAKLQATPIAFVIALYAVVLSFLEDGTTSFKKTLSLVAGGLLTALVFFIPLIASGDFSHFWNSYISWSGEYIKEPLSVLDLHKMIVLDPTLKYATYFLIIIICVLLGFQCCWIPCKDDYREWYLKIYFTFLLIVSFWVISKPGNAFLHYLMFYPPFLVLCLVMSVASVRRTVLARYYFVPAYVVLAVSILSLHPFWERLKALDFSQVDKSIRLSHRLEFHNPDLFSWLPFDNRYVAIWGWMPQWYLLAHAAPATRESHTYAQIVDSRLKTYFRQRFLVDFKESNPDYVFDAVNGDSFGFNDPKNFSPSIFPEFSELLSANFSKISSFYNNEKCPKIYARNNLNEKIKRSTVLVKDIRASATYVDGIGSYEAHNLLDRSVTEDTCIDYWLLPDGVGGAIEIGLRSPERVREVSLLNTRNGKYLDRSTNSVKLRLKYNGSSVAEKLVEMKSHPFWTKVIFPEGVNVDSIEIEVMSFSGLGGGLNEVVITR